MILLAELRPVMVRLSTGVLVATTLVAVAVCLRPTFVDGADVTLGPAAIWPGLVAGAVLGAAVGPVVALAVVHADEEGGQRQASFLAGRPSGLHLLAQVVAVGVVTVLTGAVTAVQAGLLGGIDLLSRAVAGGSTRRADVAVSADLRTADLRTAGLVAAVGLLTSGVVLLLGRVLQSAARTATTMFLALGSWLVLVLATRGAAHRGWLVLHPLAVPWSALDPSLGEAMTPQFSPAVLAASGLTWAVVLGGALVRSGALMTRRQRSRA